MSVLIKFKVERELYGGSSSFHIYAANPIECEDDLQYNKYGNIVIKGFTGKLQLDVEYRGRFSIKSDDYGYSYELQGNVYSKPPESSEEVRDFIYYSLTKQQADEVWREYPNIIELVMESREDEIDVDKLHNVGHVRIKSIVKKIRDNYKHFEFIAGLSEYELSANDLDSLEHNYKTASSVKNAISDNPYKVFGELLGKSVNLIDDMFLPDNPDLRKNWTRITLIFNSTINKINYNGSTLVEKDKVRQSLLPEYPFVYESFDELMSDSPFIIEYNGYLGLMRTHEQEKDIFNWLVTSNEVTRVIWDYDLDKYKNQGNITLTSEQVGIIKGVAMHKYSILLGSAGTGKTTSVKALISYLKDTNRSFELMTPTGVSSSVLSDMTQEESKTIHRALEYHPYKGFRRYSVDADVLIIDEISMVGVDLLHALLSRVSSNTRVVFVGDQSQLPSVSKGSIINNILKRRLCNIIQLSKVFRYTSSGLVRVATDCRNGKAWLHKNEQMTLGENKDYVFMPRYDDNILQTVVNVFEHMQTTCGIDNVKILSAYKKGHLGSRNINTLIKGLYNSGDGDICFEYCDKKFHQNDIVMHIKNNYDVSGQPVNMTDGFDYYEFVELSKSMEVYNGEVGKVVYVGEKKLVVKYKNKYIYYDYSNISQLRHSYAMTIHKSQSATFENVIMITPYAHKNMLNRNLMYTGMTRTANRLVHIGSYQAINNSLSKSEHEDRVTSLQFFDKDDIYISPNNMQSEIENIIKEGVSYEEW